jgi:nucleotide-binding universal stress UspA family protein
VSSLFSEIVAAVDDSDPAQRAAAFAVRLAAQHRGRLTFVHAVDWAGAVSMYEAGMSVADPTRIVGALRDEGRALLARVAAQARAAGVPCEERLIEARPVEAILAATREAEAHVTVIGTHGRSGIQRLVLGSIAEAVVRMSEQPVLVVHPHDTLPAGPLFQNVFIAVDGSDPSHAAVRVTAELLPKDGHRSTFCSIVDQANPQSAARKTIDRAREDARAQNLSAEFYTVDGHPETAIVEEAKKRHSDLIVLGTHGRRGLERIFLGSVAEEVLRSAPVPVLIVSAKLR